MRNRKVQNNFKMGTPEEGGFEASVYLKNINYAPQLSKGVQWISESIEKITDSEGNKQLACYAEFLSP